MCKSEIRGLFRFCLFEGPEYGPFEKRCISLTGATFWPAGPSREHVTSKGRLAHFRACPKSNENTLGKRDVFENDVFVESRLPQSFFLTKKGSRSVSEGPLWESQV